MNKGCLVPLVVIFGLISLTAAYQFNAAREKAARDAAFDAFYADPDIIAILDDASETCPQNPRQFIWACGVTLSLPKPEDDKTCSTPETPWFVGRLEFTDMSGPALKPPRDFSSWSWTQPHELAQGSLEPCAGPSCRQYSLTADSARPGSRPVFLPPDDLANEPDWPDFSDPGLYGSWRPGIWAILRGQPVWFTFGQTPLGEGALETHRPKIDISVRHPDLPLFISMTLPHDDKDHWAEHLTAIFDELKAAVLSVAEDASCTEPPVAARVKVNRFSQELLRNVRDWRRARSD